MEFLKFLINDAVTESDNPDTQIFDPEFIDPDDFVRIPLYHNFELVPDLGIRPFDRLLDLLKWNAETFANLPTLSLRAAGILQNHLYQDQLRAIETDRWVIRVSSNGYSAIIDPRGRIIKRSELGKQQILYGLVGGG